MPKSLIIIVLILAGIGYYLYRTNYFSPIEARFDYNPNGVSVDFEVKLPFLRANTPLMIEKTDFKQWNGTNLEAIRDLGEKMEFKLRCREGKIETAEKNRYFEGQTEKKPSDSGEVTESNH